MKTCFPGSIFSATSDPSIAAAIDISIGMWLDSKPDKLLVPNSPPHSVITPLRCSFLFLSGIWIPQILQAPQKHTHIKEDIQRSSVSCGKFPHKLIQWTSMSQINSQKKGKQVKEWQKERTIQFLCTISFPSPPFWKWNDKNDFSNKISEAARGLGSRAAPRVPAWKDDCRHAGEDIWEGRMWSVSEGVIRRDECSEM